MYVIHIFKVEIVALDIGPPIPCACIIRSGCLCFSGKLYDTHLQGRTYFVSPRIIVPVLNQGCGRNTQCSIYRFAAEKRAQVASLQKNRLSNEKRVLVEEQVLSVLRYSALSKLR